MREFKLEYGHNVEGRQLDWLTVLQSHLGGELVGCVSPVIGRLCVVIDSGYYKDDVGRTEDILEFGLLDPIGTDDPELEESRMSLLVTAANQVWIRKVGRSYLRKLKIHAARISATVDPVSVALRTVGYAIESAYTDAYWAVFLRDCPCTADLDSVAAQAASEPAAAAARTGATAARRDFIKKYVFPVLRDMIGNKTRQEFVLREDFYRRIGRRLA